MVTPPTLLPHLPSCRSGNECFGVSVWFPPVVKFGKTSKASTGLRSRKVGRSEKSEFFSLSGVTKFSRQLYMESHQLECSPPEEGRGCAPWSLRRNVLN